MRFLDQMIDWTASTRCYVTVLFKRFVTLHQCRLICAFLKFLQGHKKFVTMLCGEAVLVWWWCTAITRVYRWRIVERPLNIEVSCEISRQAWWISSRGPTAAELTGCGMGRGWHPSYNKSCRQGEYRPPLKYAWGPCCLASRCLHQRLGLQPKGVNVRKGIRL